MERDSFYNGNAQVAAFKRDGLLLPPTPIDSVIVFRSGALDTQEKILPLADIKSPIQPLSVFWQGNGSITFRIKQIFPAIEIINELVISASGLQFPFVALDPQLYLYSIQTSNSAIKNVTIFAKFIDIYKLYSIT